MPVVDNGYWLCFPCKTYHIGPGRACHGYREKYKLEDVRGKLAADQNPEWFLLYEREYAKIQHRAEESDGSS
jgi:hypothetical protein